MRSKIVINNNIREQINTLSYLVALFYTSVKKILLLQLTKFLWIMVLTTRTLRPSQAQKHTRLNMYNTLVLPTLLYRCDI
jgi:hypothetical protein